MCTCRCVLLYQRQWISRIALVRAVHITHHTIHLSKYNLRGLYNLKLAEEYGVYMRWCMTGIKLILCRCVSSRVTGWKRIINYCQEWATNISVSFLFVGERVIVNIGRAMGWIFHNQHAEMFGGNIKHISLFNHFSVKVFATPLRGTQWIFLSM